MKQLEVEVINKVVDFVMHMHPDETKRALKEYDSSQEAKITKDDRSYQRGFLSWFLLQKRLRNEITPIELAYLFPLDYFTKKEKLIIKNFMNSINSLFQVKDISGNKKDFILVNMWDRKKYKVKTIDFPDILKKKDYIRALIVKKVEGDYFFYGNVWTYEENDALSIKEEFIKLKKQRKIRLCP